MKYKKKDLTTFMCAPISIRAQIPLHDKPGGFPYWGSRFYSDHHQPWCHNQALV